MQEPVVEYPLDSEPPEGFGFIYSVTSPSGKKYIGKTTKSVRFRWARHNNAWRSNCRRVRHCRALFNAVRKYGAESMLLTVLECVPLDQLSDAECRAIKSHGTLSPAGYNLTPGGDGGPCLPESRAIISQKLRGRVLTPESRARMRAAQLAKAKPSAETRAKMSNTHRGRKRSPSTGEKISAALRGKPKSPAHIEAIKAAHARRDPSSYRGSPRSAESRALMSLRFRQRYAARTAR